MCHKTSVADDSPVYNKLRWVRYYEMRKDFITIQSATDVTLLLIHDIYYILQIIFTTDEL